MLNYLHDLKVFDKVFHFVYKIFDMKNRKNQTKNEARLQKNI